MLRVSNRILYEKKCLFIKKYDYLLSLYNKFFSKYLI